MPIDEMTEDEAREFMNSLPICTPLDKDFFVAQGMGFAVMGIGGAIGFGITKLVSILL